MRPITSRGASRSRRSQGRGGAPPLRLPKVLTASAPFIVGRNRQMLSVPDHREGLSTHRKIRNNVSITTGTATVTYAGVIAAFFSEIGCTIAASAEMTFQIEKVDIFAATEGGTASVQIGVVIYDEPRATTTVPANNVYFRAQDTSTTSGIASVSCVIPASARYTLGTSDAANVLSLPAISISANSACNVAVDITGSFTVSVTAGFSFETTLAPAIRTLLDELAAKSDQNFSESCSEIPTATAPHSDGRCCGHKNQ